VGKLILAASVVLLLGGIAFVLWVVLGPLGNCVPNPVGAGDICDPSNLIFVGIGSSVLGVLGLIGGAAVYARS